MKFTLFVVSILLQGIYGESLSDILAQPSSQLRNLNKLRSQLPGYYPGYIQKRQDEKEPTVITPRQDEPGMPSDPDCSSAPSKHRNALSFLFDDVKPSVLPSVLPSNRLQGVSDQIGNILFFIMDVLKCVRTSVGVKVFKKAAKRFQTIFIDTFQDASKLYIDVMECVQMYGPENNLFDTVFECLKFYVGKS